ncbi:MAG: DUF3078 domain-containing protein [candidate division KSB1 bacterium]|nr:DUF3078 domain-containing protein [candidate division KSB1 bacterium]MDZ7300883.1 DUF3078 domain-containing protein [candidate division KSB1 bacterium]MDZ7309847.1 DUF3078 domain-containing protein [candidate division KSB1 bacterium]
MRKLIFCALGLLVVNVYAQQPDTVTTPKIWTHSLVGGLNLTQVSFDNWAQGGENALAYALSMIGKSVCDRSKTNWETNYKFAFGQTRLGDQGLRKTDDKIDLETVLTYKLGTYINPYVAATLKTQFAKGYDYGTKPRTSVSKFFDPGYLTQSVGFGYQPVTQIKTRLGAALREVITSEFSEFKYADDPKTASIEKTKVEGGLELVTEVNWQLQSNLLFTGKVELFDPIKNIDKVVVRSDNTLAAKVSKYVNVNLNVQFIKDPPVNRGKRQIKETLGIGLSYSFL